VSDQEGDAGTAGHVYAALIVDQLKSEESRKASLEQRGLAIISTSGALVSLLFGLGAVAVGRSGVLGLPWTARLLLIAATAAFIVASILGLLTNAPRAYLGAHLEDLRRLLLPDLWAASEALASRRVAENRVEVLTAARVFNASKAKILQAALIAELTGIVLIGGSVVDLLLER
jgi:hypothetical protein